MEQDGEAPQPEPTAQQTNPPDGPSEEGPDRRALVIVAVLAFVLIAGLVAWMISRHDASDSIAREEERFPSPTTLAPATTVPATTTPLEPETTPSAAASTVPETPAPTPPPTPPPTAPPTAASTVAPTAAPTTVPGANPTTVPGGVATTSPSPDDGTYIGELVPNLAAYPQYLSTPAEAKVVIDELLATGRHDVATPGPVSMICAAVRLGQPLAVTSRWERDGRRIASSDLGRREAPGFGECLGNDGDPLEDGSYQYVAIDSDGNESAAGGIVIGATRVEQRFTNNGREEVCAIRVAPSVSRYFEVYVYLAQPIVAGATVRVPVADVSQDVETVGCEADEVLASFSFDPDATTPQALMP